MAKDETILFLEAFKNIEVAGVRLTSPLEYLFLAHAYSE